MKKLTGYTSLAMVGRANEDDDEGDDDDLGDCRCGCC